MCVTEGDVSETHSCELRLGSVGSGFVRLLARRHLFPLLLLSPKRTTLASFPSQHLAPPVPPFLWPLSQRQLQPSLSQRAPRPNASSPPHVLHEQRGDETDLCLLQLSRTKKMFKVRIDDVEEVWLRRHEGTLNHLSHSSFQALVFALRVLACDMIQCKVRRMLSYSI